MAIKKMKTLIVGENQYEIVDEAARADIAEMQAAIEDTSSVQDILEAHNIDTSAHADIRSSISNLSDNKLNKSELSDAIDTALATAKNSGEFDGEDGTSVTHSWSGTTLSITSASGTSSVDLKGEKGDKGDAGATGEAGTTPVRGTDYWTEADKAEIKSYVDEAILGGAW